MQERLGGKDPGWMSRIYFALYGLNGVGGVLADIAEIKAHQKKTDLRLTRIALWGGLVLVTWTLVTSANVNVERVFTLINLIVGWAKAIKAVLA